MRLIPLVPLVVQWPDGPMAHRLGVFGFGCLRVCLYPGYFYYHIYSVYITP